MTLTHVQMIDGGPDYPDVMTGCVPGAPIRVFVSAVGYYAGGTVTSVDDPGCFGAQG